MLLPFLLTPHPDDAQTCYTSCCCCCRHRCCRLHHQHRRCHRHRRRHRCSTDRGERGKGKGKTVRGFCNQYQQDWRIIVSAHLLRTLFLDVLAITQGFWQKERRRAKKRERDRGTARQSEGGVVDCAAPFPPSTGVCVYVVLCCSMPSAVQRLWWTVTRSQASACMRLNGQLTHLRAN